MASWPRTVGHPPHRSPPFADSRPLARSLARSTARAALRLLSSLRRFLFDLVMVASLHRLRCHPEPTPHGSLVAQGGSVTRTNDAGAVSI